MSNAVTELVIPDCHVPYEDKRAYELMLWAAKDQGVTGGITLLGDYGDFYAVNGHGKDPRIESLLLREVDAINSRLDELDREFPGVPKRFVEGNHEFRLDRYIAKHCPDLFGLASVSQLLKLDTRPDWTFHPYTPTQLVRVGKSKLWARHTPLSGGVLPAHSSVMKAGCSLIYGHIHTAQSSQVVMANGDTHIGLSVGWLGNAKHPAFDYVAGHHQWSLGFGWVTVLPESGIFFPETVRIIDYKCIVGDTVYEG